MKPAPIKEVLADPSHEAYAAAKDMMEKLERGEISLCGCIGPMYGEPYCACEMKRRRLPPSPEHEFAMKKAEADLRRLFGPGGTYFKECSDG